MGQLGGDGLQGVPLGPELHHQSTNREGEPVQVVVHGAHPHVALQHLYQRLVRGAALAVDQFVPHMGGLQQFAHMQAYRLGDQVVVLEGFQKPCKVAF